MPLKKSRLRYKKERSLLSDVLPYEVPISFSNRYFYEFVLEHRIEKKPESYIWVKGSDALDRLICLLLCLPYSPAKMTCFKDYVGEKPTVFRKYLVDGSVSSSTSSPPSSSPVVPKYDEFLTPFTYKIKHKEVEFRELCVPHPRSQLLVSDFYDRCKEAILYYTSHSPFSIRAPYKVAKYTFHKDKLHLQRLSQGTSQIEVSGKEYEHLKSFFVYRNYSNIYKFYESYRYHRSEKKYNNLTKLDISKCFDSIYTHSVGWATIGKDALKESLSRGKGSFPDRFDRLMQCMNMGETNGIIIGPEFSRIFAEIILQAVDRQVEQELQNRQLKHQVDYEVFRYVDDYFIFSNNVEEKELIIDELQHKLRQYKLYLNAAKAVEYEKPIITEITMAKQQIARLLEDRIKFTLEDVIDDTGEPVKKGNLFINTNELITSFKTIIRTCNVQYKDMLNYSLAIVERKAGVLIDRYEQVSPKYRSQKQIVNAIKGVIEFVFFIYAVSPRVNTTIRLCRILVLFNSFLKKGQIGATQIQVVHKLIYDNVRFILRKNKSAEHTQVETLYLLIVLTELGRDYWLEQNILAEYLGIDLKEDGTLGSPIKSLNYFSITVAIFYMRDKVSFNALREHILDAAQKRFTDHSETCQKEAELVLLLFDLLSCPYVSEDRKRNALLTFGISDPSMITEMIEFSNKSSKPQQWFTNWHGFDFAKELDAKRSQEVY